MHVINYITTVNFGVAAINCLRAECDRIGVKKPMIVTDIGVRKAGLVERIQDQLSGLCNDVVFDNTPANPNEAAVRQAAKLLKQHGCDGLIAIGGGSPIDLAKGVAVCATHEGPLSSFAAIEGGLARITSATLPVIAIPTTAGTGSEVGRGALLILDDGRKVGVLSPHIIPRSAICDPELTYGLPPFLTAATGMDAISHCIETFLSPLFNPPADGIALDGLRRAWANIELATKDPENVSARTNMMSASMQGAMAFQKGLGCVHSLSHALGGVDPSLHHGTLNAIILPSVVEFNATAASVVAEQKMARIAQAMGIEAHQITSALSEITRRLNLPHRLSDLGVSRDQFPHIVKGALADHSHKTNPRIATADEYLNLLELCF